MQHTPCLPGTGILGFQVFSLVLPPTPFYRKVVQLSWCTLGLGWGQRSCTACSPSVLVLSTYNRLLAGIVTVCLSWLLCILCGGGIGYVLYPFYAFSVVRWTIHLCSKFCPTLLTRLAWAWVQARKHQHWVVGGYICSLCWTQQEFPCVDQKKTQE